MQVNRRLYRCRHDKRIAGVASGLAEYFEIDPSLVRVLWVISFFFGGLGLFLYIVMALVVPLEPEFGYAAAAPGTEPASAESDPNATAPGAVPAGPAGPAMAPGGWHSVPAGHRHATRGTGQATTIFGVILIMFGALALVDIFLPAWADSGRFLWPAFIVGLGALLVLAGVRREPTSS
jgi:phage shock protein PspC (stress-responsive transcriptional regulator)